MTSAVVLAIAQNLGIYCKNASSVLTGPDAARVRSKLASTTAVRSDRPRLPLRHDRRLSTPRRNGRHVGQVFQDPSEAALARCLGTETVRPKHGPQSRLTGLAAALKQGFSRPCEDDARHLAGQWANKVFAEAEASQWWDAGLKPDDSTIAAALAAQGIKAEHLALRVNGQRIGALLRGGASAAHIAGHSCGRPANR